MVKSTNSCDNSTAAASPEHSSFGEEMLNIDRYFERIGYSGPREPNLAMLRALHERHPIAIPFENLNPLLDQPVDLDQSALEAKLVGSARGGYCFEQNLLFWRVLEQIGFHVSGLSARVLWNRPSTEVTPRTHMLLRIELDESTYLADVGFGGTTLTAPLKLVLDTEQETPHERFRLRETPLGYLLEAELVDRWAPLYQFDLAPQFPVDYSIANYYLSNSEHSHFRTGLFVARPAEGGVRLALRNSRFSTHSPHTPTTTRHLIGADEAIRVLDESFGIHVPDSGKFTKIWEQIRQMPDPI